MKRCTKCGEQKPLAEFNRDSSRKSGYHPWCKPCARKRRSGWYDENRDSNLTYQARWREKNRERKREYDRAYRQANLDERRAKDAAYRLENAEKIDARIRSWLAANPDRKRDHRRNRRARKSGALVSRVYFKTILLRDLGICGICAKPIMENTIELDHIIPLVAGGTHEPSNVQLAHRACNRRKSAKVNFTLADAA